MKPIKKFGIQLIYRYYALLSFVTKGKQSIVRKKLLYGALIIGIGSQYACKQAIKESKVNPIKQDTNHLTSINNGYIKIKDSTNATNNVKDDKKNLKRKSIKEVFPDKESGDIENVLSLNKEVDNTNVTCYAVVETMPEYLEGNEAISEYLKREVRYPDSARIKGIQGVVYVSFVVGKTGELSQIKILRGIGSGCDEEAIRVVKAMPKWKPGKQNGEVVPVQFNLPIKFILH